jgi:hypothetical protein
MESELSRAIDACVRSLRTVASGEESSAAAFDDVSTLQIISNLAPKTADTLRAQLLIAAFRAFEFRCPTNPTLARHELELAILQANAG